MDDNIKVNFIKPMLVLKIRDMYKAPYHKNKFLSIPLRLAESKKELLKHLQDYTKNWSSGVYELQFLFQERDYAESNIYSTFMRFDVRDGKIVKLWKLSPYSKKEYPCWKYFKLDKKKLAKKKVAKKKVARKKPPRKIAKKKVIKKKVSKKRVIKKKIVKRKVVRKKR